MYSSSQMIRKHLGIIIMYSNFAVNYTAVH